MKLKNKKGLYAYTGTDSEALQFLNAFKEVFGVDLLPFLGDKPISSALGDSLRAFDENPDDMLPEVGTENRQQMIDSGALPLLFKINGQTGSLIGYIYELKNWYKNKLTTGKVVYEKQNPMIASSPYKYMYIADKVFTPAQKLAMFEKEFKDNYLELGGLKADKSNASINAWEDLINRNANQNETRYYKGFYNDYMNWYKSKRLMADSSGSSSAGGTGAGSGTGNVDASGNSNNPTETYTEGNLIENDALAFLHEIEKYSPLNWGGLKYWYKELMAKKKEVSKEVFNFAYDYWLKKLNAEYMTFDATKQEKEKPDYDLINGYIFEKPKKAKKKYGLLATILRKLFNKN